MATDGIALSCNFWQRGQLKQPALPKRRRVEPAPINMAAHNAIIVGKGQVFWNAVEAPFVLGCDPGRSDLLHLCNDDQQSLTRLTKNELYSRSGFNKAARQREATKTAGVIEIETKQPSWKVATTDLFHQAIDYKLAHDRALWELRWLRSLLCLDAVNVGYNKCRLQAIFLNVNRSHTQMLKELTSCMYQLITSKLNVMDR